MKSYRFSALPIFVLVLSGTDMTAQSGSLAVSNMRTPNTPRFVESTGVKDLGTADPQEMIEVTLWLALHNRADLDTLAHDLYDSASSRYRNWLSYHEFVARYAPTAAESKRVASYLRAQGFEVTGADAYNFYVRARASIGLISNTFRVSLRRYQLPTGTYRSNTGDPVLDASISGLVRFVSGLDDYPLTASLVDVPFSGESFTAVCFPGTKSETVIGAPGDYPYLRIASVMNVTAG